MSRKRFHHHMRRICFELIEPRYCLSAIAFASHNIECCSASGARSVYAGDLDGDGDMDILSASSRDDKIAWYENTDGQGTFGDQQVISNQAVGARSVYAGDMDGDGDMDILSASYGDDKIAWYENTNGQGTFGDQQVISNQADGANSVFAGDLDGDGDMDILSASSRDDKIAWYENTDGQGTFGDQQVITTHADRASDVHAADLDGDGDMDVLSASDDDDKIAWHENTDGQGTFGDQEVISNEADSASDVHAVDLDGDGDMDVLSGFNGGIAWYENTDGLGTFGVQQVITTQFFTVLSVHAADLDGDGDMDVLSNSPGGTAWYEQRLIGDVNDDGRFDSSDLVKVFQRGEYEDRGRYNSTYEEGDWNADGEFDSSDLVLAFQAGVYERPPAQGEIAAAVDWLFAQDQRDIRQRAFVA